MSTEEDLELKDIIAKCLESNGVLGKIRAELRANTFLTIDQQEDSKIKFPTKNSALLNYASSEDGQIVLSLIREFLTFFNMQYTLSIFDPESSQSIAYQSINRSDLAAQVGLNVLAQEEPVLQTILKVFKIEISKQSIVQSTCKETLTQKISPANRTNTNAEVAVLQNEVDNEYDEDFQSSSSVSELKINDIKEASVDEELVDISTSELLVSQGSNADQDTVDKTTSNSTITGADYVANVANIK